MGYGERSPQARLAEAVVNGVPLSDAAEQLGIQLPTRNAPEGLLAKSGTGRQVKLVAWPCRCRSSAGIDGRPP